MNMRGEKDHNLYLFNDFSSNKSPMVITINNCSSTNLVKINYKKKIHIDCSILSNFIFFLG